MSSSPQFEDSNCYFAGSFWETLADKGDSVALVETESNRSWTYQILAAHVADMADFLSASERDVVFLFGENDFGGVVAYLGSLLAGHAVYLLSIRTSHPAVKDLIERYKPEFILARSAVASLHSDAEYIEASSTWGYQRYIRRSRDVPSSHPDLALLMSTSASTGSPKTVRISRRSLVAGASQAIGSLSISSCDHVVTSLPFTHVYGLSILNSHLATGARLVLQRRSVGDPVFWSERVKSPWTTFAGLTLTYDVMRQRRIGVETLCGVHKLLHSGDRMPPDLFSWLYETFAAEGANIFLMYGQTETCGRISVLPPTFLPTHSTSVGKPVPFSKITISNDREIIYSGPNTMMGYANRRDDLRAEDQMRGQVHTGDCGYLDSDGMLYITGRLGRICKIFGQRVCLDDIENGFRDVGQVAVVSDGNSILVFFEGSKNDVQTRMLVLSKTYRLPPQAFELRGCALLPRTDTGKICYRALGEITRGC